MKKPLFLRLLAAGLRGLVPQSPQHSSQHRHKLKNRHEDIRHLNLGNLHVHHGNGCHRNVHHEDVRHLNAGHLEVYHLINVCHLNACHSERSEEPPYFIRSSTKHKLAAIARLALLLPALILQPLAAQSNPLTGPQQLVFTGLLGSSNPTQLYAQFNAVQSDASGNLYLLLDQKDGVRLLKTDPTATNILAQAKLGAAGDIGLAMALDPSGNLYITGTTTSGTLQSTSGAAFPSAADNPQTPSSASSIRT
jgi:hypothetical protein